MTEATDAPEEETKTLTNSRWQDGNNTPRYDKRQAMEVDTILKSTSGFARGARITKRK